MPEKGFFGRLFDLSFSEFVTTKLIKFLYILILIGIAIAYLVAVVGAFSDSFWRGLLVLLIVGPVGAFFAVLWSRVYMELLIVLFRIAEHVTEIARRGRFEQ